MSTLPIKTLKNSKTPRSKILRKRSALGFTLIETMVVIAVIAILASLALPSFTELIKNNRLITKSNDLVTAISTARQYAIARSLTVFVCQSANADAATPSCGGSGSSWNSGYLVYSVLPNTLPPTTLRAYVNSGTAKDNLLRQANLKSDDNITVTSTVATNYIAFTSNGLLAISGAVEMEICDDRTAETGRQINISTAGRINAQELACS